MNDAATANGQPLKTRFLLRERLGVGGQGGSTAAGEMLVDYVHVSVP